MEASDPVWSDYESLRHNIKHNTVDKLKQILTGLNEECATNFFKSGKKQDIIDRIVAQLEIWRQEKNEDKWIKAKAVLYQVRTSGTYAPPRASAVASHSASTAPISPYSSTIPTTAYHAPPATTRYDPYGYSRKPSGSNMAVASTSTVTKLGIKFKPSPFFDIDQAVSSIVECPESTGATNRQQQTFSFTLTTEQIAKLKQPSSKYQLRLFCTSSHFYSPGANSFRTNTSPCPVEFPPTCEVRVNNSLLTANLKGLKKKPGTAPPADLGKTVSMNNARNRVEMVYVNTQQPTQPNPGQPSQSKKYYLVVMLVEVTTVDQLVERLKKGKYRALEDVRQKMKESAAAEDDDIIAGPQKMSLKCPLSFMRINTPCRSSKCVHSQCFDATSWFSVMEQTTTWLCPVCERVLNFDDLIIDGYFDDILKQSPDSVEDVMVEADGEWHTPDNKYASAVWKASHPPAPAVKQPPTPRKSLPTPKSPSHTPTKNVSNGIDKRKGSNVEILILDSDDEDEGRVKRELSPSFASGSSASANRSFDGTSVPQSQSDDVIDLTLDSDDEEPLQSRSTGKRKAADEGMSPTEQIWKKGRTDIEPSSTSRVQNINGGSIGLPPTPGASYPAIPHRSPALPPPASLYPQAAYVPPTLPPVYPNYQRPIPPRGGSTGSAQLPPSYNRGPRWA